MTPFTTILTHPGSAHKDEFLACCVLLATAPAPIVRREPTEADLADPAIAVVDVGHRHEPALKNFDHHQLPDDAAPTCALSLVLQHLGLYDDARAFCDWLEPGEPLWEIMRLVGTDLLDYLRNLRTRLTFIGAHAELWSLDTLGADKDGRIPAVVFVPRTEPLPEDPSAGLDRYVQEQGLDERVVAVIAPDRRGGGYGLSRHRDHPRLDFTRIAHERDVHFAHLRGFVAKTSATDPQRLRQLLLNAAV
jgi:hypothetical protein